MFSGRSFASTISAVRQPPPKSMIGPNHAAYGTCFIEKEPLGGGVRGRLSL